MISINKQSCGMEVSKILKVYSEVLKRGEERRKRQKIRKNEILYFIYDNKSITVIQAQFKYIL